MRVVMASILVWGSTVLAYAAELDLPNDKPHVGSDPCLVTTMKGPAKPIEALQVSRRSAVYIIQHVHKACRYLTEIDGGGAGSEAIRGDLYDTLVRPTFLPHPGIADTLPQSPSPPKVSQATPRDIGRTTASRLDDEITRLQISIAKLGKDNIDRAADESAKKALESFVEATTELSFAGKIAHDAYPDLFAKSLKAVPHQPRTAESDAAFRRGAPPKGSVKLSNAAHALVQSFMRDVHRVSGSEHVASMAWAREQRSKHPGDSEWSDSGAGWVLGARPKIELPPDVIDTVRGIEIVFTAEDPSALAGKTFDATKKKLFVRD